jgi:hypothetical protein
MGGAYLYMDLNAKYGKLLLRFYYDRTSGAGDGDGCFLTCSWFFYVLWRFWYHLMVTRSKGRYQYWCMITYPWFIHSFIQYFNFVDHQNFLRNTQLSRHSRKKHGRIGHQFYLLFMCFIFLPFIFLNRRAILLQIASIILDFIPVILIVVNSWILLF